MTTIKIKNGAQLTKTQFEDIEDLREYLFLISMENSYTLSSEQIELLKTREKIADSNTTVGLTWEDMKAGIKRKNV